MSNIYVESILKVSHGARFSISFQNRSLKIDGKYIIKNGEYEGDLGLDKIPTPLPRIAVLYDRYQHSVPSERSDKKRKKLLSSTSIGFFI